MTEHDGHDEDCAALVFNEDYSGLPCSCGYCYCARCREHRIRQDARDFAERHRGLLDRLAEDD